MRPAALAFLLATVPAGMVHATGPVRTDDPQRLSAPVATAPRPVSKNAFGQAMAELARGLKQVRPAEAAGGPRPAPTPATAATASPASPPRPPAAGG